MSLVTLLGGLGAVLFFFGRFGFLGWQAATPGGHLHDSRLLALEADAKPEGDGPLPRRRRHALPRAVALRRRARPLPRGAGFVLRLRPREVAPLQPAAHVAPAARGVLDRDGVGRGRPFPRAADGRRRAARPAHRVRSILLGALAIVVFGSLFGEALGINDKLGSLWFWFGHQGSEYLDLGRFWQILLAVGLVLWLFLMFRALQARDEEARPGRPRAAVPLRRGRDPGLLPARALLRPARQLRGDRQLALLDHPPLGRRLLRALRHGARRRDLLPDGTRHREERNARRLPRRDPLPRRGHHRHGPPLVLHGTGRAQHGPRVVLLGDGGRAADAPDARCVGLRAV